VIDINRLAKKREKERERKKRYVLWELGEREE
jgi:hypothetical protein